MSWHIFFFKQQTAYEMRISGWSSDVCSSDLRSIPPKHPATPRISRWRPYDESQHGSGDDRHHAAYPHAEAVPRRGSVDKIRAHESGRSEDNTSELSHYCAASMPSTDGKKNVRRRQRAKKISIITKRTQQ